MKYKLMGENDYVIDPMKQIADNRGVDDINALLSVSKENTHSPYLLENIKLAAETLIEAIKKEKKIHIVVDSDADGITSASIMFLYLKELNYPHVTWNCHEKKIHGIYEEELDQFDYDILIVPDAGTNDAEKCEKLVKQGKQIIILDHHEKEIENEWAIIVNPKSCNYPNKEISGAIVVHKFCEVLDDFLNVSFSKKFLDLPALGAIADMMDSRVLETRYYCFKGLQNITNKMFRAIVDKQQNKIGGTLTIQNVQFYIAPLINSVFRVGTKEEIETLFKGFITTEDIEVDYKKRGVGIVKVKIHEDIARELANIKARQDRTKEKLVEAISKMAESFPHKIILLNVSLIENPEMLGLISNEIANTFHRPTILLKEGKDGLLKGSARNFSKFEVTELKSFLKDLPFEFLAGHENAFGVGLREENLQKIIDGVVEKTKDITTEEMYHVDFSMDSSHLNKTFVNMLDRNSKIWGTQLEEPYIHVFNLKGEDIVINEKQTMISFTQNKLKYVIFHPTQEDIENLVNKNVTLEVIGRASINRWNGEETPQFVIDKYEISCYNKDTSFWF